MNKIVSAACILALFSACNAGADKTLTRPAVDMLASHIDTTVKPSADFFEYANGGWLKQNPIPASESGWGIGNVVQDTIYNRLRKINEDAVGAHAANGTITQKIGDFWQGAMDTVELNKAGISPLRPDLDKIDAIQNVNDLIRETAELKIKGIRCLFSDYVTQDDKNSNVMVYKLGQGGLGMPNRDYYFNTDARTEKVRKAYKDYLLKTFEQLGGDSITAQRKATAVYALETKLAAASRRLQDLRDPYKNYHKMAAAQLRTLAPVIDWNNYSKAIGISNLDTVVMGQPEFYTALNTALTTIPVGDWKSYLQFHLIQSQSAYLDSVSFNNAFSYASSLSGAKDQRPRWKRVLDAEEHAIGEALGQLFVKEYFNATAKKRYNDLVENIREAYKDRINKLSWMSAPTKEKALAKLAKITKKVGYPDTWKDFSALKIDNGSYVMNMERANTWWHNYNINKLGKPVDRTEWSMTPQTYNAYYNPGNNEIVLPAGIFAVPGYKDADLDDALVYGYAAASTIGHEITHGFDDEGRQYDAEGNLKSWWTVKDSTEFSNRAKKIIRQFDEFNPVDTLHINGNATQGENIADLGGMLLGLDAFKKTDTYKKNKKIGGFTQLQRYFLGYALGWLSEERKEHLASQVMTDVHAPAKERVNGPVVNIPEFYEAFDVKPGDKMYRPDSLRVKIW
jgi:putative endopeptidase